MAESRKHQVSLRGSSAKEITRDALLQKVSNERELRNYTRRAAAAALFIQRVWRRYSVTKKVVTKVQEEWVTIVNNSNVLITGTWISSTLLRPFLFFTTRLSIGHQKLQTTNMKCMVSCFKILLQSMNATDSQRNFCSLATGTLEERTTWIYQAKKLISVSTLILAEYDHTCPVGHDSSFLTSLAMRLVVALTDLKGWKCINNDNRNNADTAVRGLVEFIAIGKNGFYSCIRSYIIKLDPREGGLQKDNHLLIIASAITLALRPFHAAKSDSNDSVHMDVQDAVDHYCVFLLTVSWLTQRLPAVLRPALKHQSVLSPCLSTLLVVADL